MRPRMLAPVLAALLALSACTAGQTGPDDSEPTQGAETSSPAPGTREGAASGEPTLTVRTVDGRWMVRGTGFDGGNQYLVQCAGGTKAGASSLDKCDMSTSKQAVADADGRIQVQRKFKTFVNVGSVSEVDCSRDPCALAVADLSDRVLVAAHAALPRNVKPPEAPTFTLSEEKFRAERGRVTVTGKGFKPGTEVRVVQCVTRADGGVNGDNCLYDEGKRVVADSTGSVLTGLPVQREIKRVDGGVTDCATSGACVIAHAWTKGGRMVLADLHWK